MNKFVVALLLMVVLVDMLCPTEAWWSSRRRRRRTPTTRRPRPTPKPCNKKMTHLGLKNDYDGYFKFTCPAGQAIRYFGSIYSSCARDRVFDFHCSSNRATKKMKRCSWTHHWVNDWDQPIIFTCPFHGVLAGVESCHSNPHEDRRFKFYCCHSNKYHARYCKTSSYSNNWRSNIAYWTPKNRFIVGAISFHSNHKEDRCWMFQYCQVY